MLKKIYVNVVFLMGFVLLTLQPSFANQPEYACAPGYHIEFHPGAVCVRDPNPNGIIGDTRPKMLDPFIGRGVYDPEHRLGSN